MSADIVAVLFVALACWLIGAVAGDMSRSAQKLTLENCLKLLPLINILSKTLEMPHNA